MTESQLPEDFDVSNEKAFQELVWTLEMSEGQFVLVLARCNYGKVRSHLLRRLEEECSLNIRVVYLEQSINTLYSTLVEELQGEQPSAVMVVGLESVSNLETVLTSTNQVREEFRKSFAFPLVLWVDDQILRLLVRLVPDFRSWGRTINFAIATEELITLLTEEVDAVFSAVLVTGKSQLVVGCQELDSALADLQSRGEELAPNLKAGVEFLLGREAYAQGEIEQALDHYQNSWQIWQNDLNEGRWQEAVREAFSKGVGRSCLLNLRFGVLLFHIGLAHLHCAEREATETSSPHPLTSLSQARNYLQQSLDIFERAERRDLVSKFITQLGQVLQQLSAWDDLQALAEKGLDLHQTYGKKAQLAQDYGFLAVVAGAKSEWREAKKAAEQALRIAAEDLELEQAHHIQFYLILAEAEQHLGNLSTAVALLEKAVRECQPQEQPLPYIRALELLRSLYYQQGEYLAAFELKQKQRSLEQQFGLRAFVGAVRLEPLRQKLGFEGNRSLLAEEIEASGRQEDVKRLIERITRNDCKLTVIHGQSGVGKSSIINGGLVPALQQRTIAARRVLPITVRVYQDWAEELEKVMTSPPAPLLQGEGSMIAPLSQNSTLDLQDQEPLPNPPLTKGRELVSSLNQGRELVSPLNKGGLRGVIPNLLEQLRENQHRHLLTVLIFDQFEEFFFVHSEPTQRKAFFAFLAACLDIPFVKVILSLREDYLHYLLECNRQQNLGVINQDILSKHVLYYLGNFSPEDAKKLIERLTKRTSNLTSPPAPLLQGEGRNTPLYTPPFLEEKVSTSAISPCRREREGWEGGLGHTSNITGTKFNLEPALIEQLVADLAAELGEVRPIELQVVGAQLQTEKITRLEEYQQKGPKGKLVERYLEEVIEDCGPGNEKAARSVLYLLTDENNTRPLKTKAELARDLAAEADKLDLVLEIFVQSGLLFLLPAVPENHYQLVHDYLVRFIRQQKGSELLAELAAEREERIKTEAKYKRFLQRALASALGGVLLLTGLSVAAIVFALSAQRQEKIALNRELALQAALTNNLLESLLPRSILLAIESIENSVKKFPPLEAVQVLQEGVPLLLPSIPLHHEGFVSGVAFSSDGKYLATASWDNTVRLWSVSTGEQLQRLNHEGFVSGVAFSSDGKYLATASWDNTVRLWSVSTGEQLQRLNHEGYVSGVAFSSDGKYLATASWDKTVRLWSVSTGEQLQRLNHEGPVTGVAFSSDGKYLASASRDKTARLWSVSTGEQLQRLNHEGEVSGVAFSSDGKYLATASWDKTAQLWLVQPRDLVSEACHLLTRNLTWGEWQQYFGDNPRQYQPTCPNLPIHGSVITAIVEETEDTKKAVAVVRKILASNTQPDSDSTTEASSLVAAAFVEKGENLAWQGEIKPALKAYREAQKLDTKLQISANSWATICRYGSLNKQAAEVMFACEKAVNLEAENGWIRDNRGLARALTGDKQGAIEDFQAFVDKTNDKERKAQRQAWIKALRAGENPFTEEVIEKLKRGEI